MFVKKAWVCTISHNCHNFPVHVFVKITFEFQKVQSKRKNLLENWDGIAGMRGMFVKNEWVTKITQHNFPVSSLIFTGWTDDIQKANCGVDDVDVALVLVYFWRISDGTDADCCCCCWVWKFDSVNSEMWAKRHAGGACRYADISCFQRSLMVTSTN